ncbi:hypothetical protein NGRA_0685 [Nosema granulosis]|uniref:Uncharacterized protein n=1 Tax=Nosema granulosis TaxID=83296 RepID=A0A9P6H0Y9_9MICR|nr:hypothetical protein NGRA_0685 [Nosema granulosis]
MKSITKISKPKYRYGKRIFTAIEEENMKRAEEVYHSSDPWIASMIILHPSITFIDYRPRRPSTKVLDLMEITHHKIESEEKVRPVDSIETACHKDMHSIDTLTDGIKPYVDLIKAPIKEVACCDNYIESPQDLLSKSIPAVDTFKETIPERISSYKSTANFFENLNNVSFQTKLYSLSPMKVEIHIIEERMFSFKKVKEFWMTQTNKSK